ncbi:MULTISPECIES: hypothetical protein [Vibrio harveyi group]|nr:MULTISPECIES: hypothetical protein [Vibrio harveyi group]MBS9834888.1 hypothetical protein [Vibrio alginolyticus]WHT05031.1 hypothetical protein O2T11_24250 [Vibrio parahaemolyticus]HBC3983214.1 hypothetical protein [Vibrio parahaemolyticus]
MVNSLAGDQAITSGESGVITLVVLDEIVKHNVHAGFDEEKWTPMVGHIS